MFKVHKNVSNMST